MIIILEGCDGSGKTTLAQQISKQTGYPVLHRSTPKTEEEKARMMQEYKQVIKESKNVIFDRCWYSEIVYGSVMRDESVISYPEMYALEHMLARSGALIIYCTDNPKTLWKRCLKRGEDYIKDFDTFMAIYNMYEVVMSVPHLVPVVKYGYEEL